VSKLKYLEWPFKGRHFDREVNVLCVRWYLRYKLSLRDLVERHCQISRRVGWCEFSAAPVQIGGALG
jgi:hypothetical protein